jgi:hypothetical protein
VGRPPAEAASGLVPEMASGFPGPSPERGRSGRAIPSVSFEPVIEPVMTPTRPHEASPLSIGAIPVRSVTRPTWSAALPNPITGTGFRVWFLVPRSSRFP